MKKYCGVSSTLRVFRVTQQVAVIDGAQAEELEQLVAVVIDGVVEQRGVGFDEVGGLIVDQTNQATSRDGLRELLDVLVAQFFVDVGGEQATGELGVVRLFDDVGGRGADGQLVELDRGCTIVQAADRASGDAHGVDTSRDPRRIVGCASGNVSARTGSGRCLTPMKGFHDIRRHVTAASSEAGYIEARINSGACDARTHLDPGFDVCSDVFAPMLLPPSSSTFTAMHIKVTSGHVRANRLQLDHMSDLDHKLTPAEPHRVVVLKLASKDGEISKRTSKDSGSTGLTTAPSFLIDDSAAPPYAACRQLLWRPTVPGRTMHPGAGLSRLAPVSGFKASGTIPSAGLNVFFDRNIGAHRQAGRSKSFARKSDAQKHSWSPSRAGHAPRATYVDPRGRAGLLQSLIRGDRPLSPSTSMVSTGARVSILEAASRPQARPLPRRPYQAAQGQQTVADSVVARSTRRPSPHRDPLPRCSAASCGPIATAGFDLVKPPVSPSNGSTSCAEKSTSDTTLSRTVLAADYTPKANSHPAVLAPTKTESSVRRFPIADSLVVEDGVHDGVDVGLRCLVGHVVDRVACQVVALVELLAGNATPDVGLLWRLEHFGAGEQASSGDAHVDERLILDGCRALGNRDRRLEGRLVSVVHAEHVVRRRDHVEVEVRGQRRVLLVGDTELGVEDVLVRADQTGFFGAPPGEAQAVLRHIRLVVGQHERNRQQRS
ncbi:hypothetical protein GQR58_029674 [Nymphon striatum]|nr:hypothetical protein GQR58_029674 [Nymphon striatum]